MLKFKQIHFEEIDSTNNYLKNNYQHLDDFTFASADYQSQGKGRNDRTWISKAGENLMFSLLIKDDYLMERPTIISLVVAVEVAVILETYGIKKVSIKWPNDVLVGDKKICGILAEGQLPNYLVVGVGLNVNQKDFPSDLRRPATSIFNELGKEIPVEDIKDTLYKRLAATFENLDTRFYFRYYKKHNFLKFKWVRVSNNGSETIAKVYGVDENFGLQAANDNGSFNIFSGEIEIIDNKPDTSITPDLIPGVIAVALLIVGVILLDITFITAGIICIGAAFVIGIPWFFWSNYRSKKRRGLILNNHIVHAVIFDMDGTLIDSTGLWHEIDKQFFLKRNMELPKDYAQNIVHLGLAQAAKYTKETYGLKESEQEIMDEWHQMSLDMYRNDVQLKPGALELLKYFKKKGIKMAIATANDEALYMPCIERLGIGKYFSHIADVNNVKEGKQSAKIYQFLAEKMNVSKENVLVVEDMPTCIKTAYDNGFITVAVYDDASKNYVEQKKENSHLFVNNLTELKDALK